MGYTIKLLPVVHKDLRAAKKWYNDQKAELGKEFKIEVIKRSTILVSSLSITSENIKNCDSLW
jgi:hypothetical protein